MFAEGMETKFQDTKEEWPIPDEVKGSSGAEARCRVLHNIFFLN